MRLTRGRIALLAVLVVVLAGAATAATWAAGRGTGWSRSGTGWSRSGPGMMGGSGPGYGAGSGYGPGGMMGGSGYGPGYGAGSGYGPGGMMGGSGYGPGMMGGSAYGLPGDGQRVTSLDAARSRAQAFAGTLSLTVGEVIRFDNGFYAELLTGDGRGATEVLVDPASGAVTVEHGPAMMWNTRYGMHPQPGAGPATVSAAQATRIARQWLAGQHTAALTGLTTGDPEAFPGYYTMETRRGGTIVSMMSVNAYTGAVWYHTWHGRFIASQG